MSFKPDRSRGFTLLELLVVVAVVAVLASVVAPAIFGNLGDAKQAAARTQLSNLALALDSYRLDNDWYPTTEQGLRALTERPTTPPTPARWRGPYLRREIPTDPWKRPYHYSSPADSVGQPYAISSHGRDGTLGGEGEDADIHSWRDAAE